ncbi:MAG: dTMP kinase [Pirellulaceae bacterium]|jgi:dTMP kinase
MVFLAFDGIDGAGKSTQIQLLTEWLEGQQIPCELVRDPGSSPLGEAVRDLLLHREEIPIAPVAEMLLYMAARAQLVAQRIVPALAAGKWVISDRFLLANVVYQGAGHGLPMETLWDVGGVATQQLSPDITILLDLPVERAMSRMKGPQDRLEKRGQDYFQRVRDGFLTQLPRASRKTLVVDATQTPEVIHQRIVAFLTSTLKVGDLPG